MSKSSPVSAVLLISCPDQRGIVNAVTGFLLQHRGNILYLDQHVDLEQNVFFMRIEWEVAGFGLKRDDITAAFKPLAEQFHMNWKLHFSDVVQRIAVFVSKQSHCLFDVLGRFESGEWPVQIPLVISNHPDLGPLVRNFGIRFEYLPMTAETKAVQERRALCKTVESQRRLDRRSGIEGTHSELTRGYRLRRSRYRGLRKTDIQMQFTAAACNLHRWAARLCWLDRQQAMRAA